jgi:hypothetical protein
MVAGFVLICSTTSMGVKKSSSILKTKLTLISRKKRMIQTMFHVPCAPHETLQIFSEAFPDAMDNKGVIRRKN